MRVFLSYHTPDLPTAQKLKAALEAAIPGLYVFLAHEALVAGTHWHSALIEEIDRSDGFIILLGQRVGDWQRPEYDAAFKKWVQQPGYRLLPIQIADSPVNLPNIDQFHWIKCHWPASEPDLSKIVAALDGAASASRWRAENPFHGLASLGPDDGSILYGRGDELDAALANLADGVMAGSKNKIVVLVGNSGVGKSSLAEAGVFASLQREALPDKRPWPDRLAGSSRWALRTLRPGPTPLRALANSIVDMWFDDPTDSRRIGRRSEWADQLEAGRATLSDMLDATVEHLARSARPVPSRFVININQAEELFTLASEEARRSFTHVVTAALADKRLSFIASLRSDFYGNLQRLEALFRATAIVDVLPFQQDDLVRIVERSAERFGVTFETPELPKLIVKRAAGERNALPLLTDYMTDVWTSMQARGDGVIRFVDQVETAPAGRSLSNRADRFLKEHPEDTEIVKRLFVHHLSAVIQESQAVRRMTPISAFSDDERRVANMLASQEWRLLSIGNDRGAGGDLASADVAHEILLSDWNTYRSWIDEQRDILSFRLFLTRSMKQHELSNRSNSTLLYGYNLDRAAAVVIDGELIPSIDETKYVADSTRNNIYMVGAFSSIASVIFYTYVTFMSILLSASINLLIERSGGQRLGMYWTFALGFGMAIPACVIYAYRGYRRGLPHHRLLYSSRMRYYLAYTAYQMSVALRCVAVIAVVAIIVAQFRNL